jgi:hypothetical protein
MWTLAHPEDRTLGATREAAMAALAKGWPRREKA